MTAHTPVRLPARAMLACLLAGLMLAMGMPAAAAATRGARAVEPAARGLVYDGLRPTPDGPCGMGFALEVEGLARVCSHGPDAGPPDRDVRTYDAAEAEGVASTSDTPSGSVKCIGDGSSGPRVEAIYAYAAGRTDRYGTVAGYIPSWAGTVEATVDLSAAKTGGKRHVRFLTDSSCNLVIRKVKLSSAGDDSFANTINELASLGYNRSDRKYLVWMDSNVYCGIAQVYGDDRPGQENYNNGARPMFARVDAGCWDWHPATAHEVMHTLGSVQGSAPHATPGSHCWDESDAMCYDDGTAMQQVCATEHEPLFDCGNDDYFHTKPPSGSYLATHWNTANSKFLEAALPSPAGLKAAYGDGWVSLGWKPIDDVSLSSYRVYRDGSLIASPTLPSQLANGLTNGKRYRFDVTALDSDGIESTPSTAYVTPRAHTVSVAAPTLSGPTVSFGDDVRGISASNVVLHRTSSGASVPVTLSCRDRADVSTSCSSGAVATALLRVEGGLIPGDYYGVTVVPDGSTAMTWVGDGTPVAKMAKTIRTSVVEQQTSLAGRYSWRTYSSSDAHGGSYTADRLRGASARFSFTGPSVTWYTRRGPSQGKAAVYVDGALRLTFNGYSRGWQMPYGVLIDDLSDGPHTVEIKVLGEKGSSAGTGTYVSLDAFKVGGVLNAKPAAAYRWGSVSSSGASGGSYAVSDKASTAHAFTFRGTSVTWYTIGSAYQGKAKVYIDDRYVATVDNYYSSTRYGYARRYAGLRDGVHTIRIVVLGQKRAASKGTRVIVDRWVVT